MTEGTAGILDRNRQREVFATDFNNNNMIDKTCAFLLALMPILQYYVGLFQNLGITLLIVVTVWYTIRFLQRIRSVRIPVMIVGLLVFQIYKNVIHEVNFIQISFAIVSVLVYVAAASGLINLSYFVRVSARIAMIASVLIILQYICYYVFDFHLQLVRTSLLIEDAGHWVALAKDGLTGIRGVRGTLYRPSAFFLEPSHMFLYLFPHIFIILMTPGKIKWKLQKAALLSIGLVLTTSGMGILTVAFAWVAYFALVSGKMKKVSFINILKPRNLTMVIIFIILVVVLVTRVSVLREAFLRIIDTSNRGAVAGRNRLAIVLVKSLNLKGWLIGVSATVEGIDHNMPGFFATLYKFGLGGVLLSYSVYLYGVIRYKNAYFWISVFVIIVSFFSAQTHGTFYMFYYTFMILHGRNLMKQEQASSETGELRTQP